ncbi:MAG: dTDP-4-dehydrorhamnose 3,5-epimerase [Flavobacteriaceae bacterium]|nr:dTDP-4-dehydrorhamnose 3,5-epimerase [Flavobacteriaceae bacterium]
MKLIETNIKDLLVCTPDTFTDERGYFMETFREEWLPNIAFIQENESFSKKGVLRGLHYQTAPFAQAKLVRCIMGKVLDVAVDLRKSSPTFGQHYKVELSGENKKQIFIPQGFAHGFLTLSDWAVIAYKVDNYYCKEAEQSIRFDDADLGIEWGMAKAEIMLSAKDKEALPFASAKIFE